MNNKQIVTAFAITLFCTVSSQTLVADAPIQGNEADGKIKAVLCFGCHGLNGEGRVMPNGQPSIPLIAGQIPGYFVKSLYEYKTDKRLDPMMNAVAKGLTDIDIANLAAYYATLKRN
ncbi:MAG: cytochrome c [Pseudomonadota bacterium]|nr:cytochrome c [Pseudomonadota bacterium]